MRGPFDDEFAVPDRLTLDRFIEGIAKGVIAENADLEWRLGVGKSFLGPLNELGKVEQECSFDLILLGRRREGVAILRRQAERECQATKEDCQRRQEAWG